MGVQNIGRWLCGVCDGDMGDMLSADGDAVAAVEARIPKEWNKIRQFVPLLTNKDVTSYEWSNYTEVVCIDGMVVHRV